MFDDSLNIMEEAFRVIESMVPSPQMVPYANGFVFRHVEEAPQQAIVQKLARVLSGINAARILLLNGYVQ